MLTLSGRLWYCWGPTWESRVMVAPVWMITGNGSMEILSRVAGSGLPSGQAICWISFMLYTTQMSHHKSHIPPQLEEQPIIRTDILLTLISMFNQNLKNCLAVGCHQKWAKHEKWPHSEVIVLQQHLFTPLQEAFASDAISAFKWSHSSKMPQHRATSWSKCYEHHYLKFVKVA